MSSKKTILILGSLVSILIVLIIILMFLINRSNLGISKLSINGNNNDLVSKPNNTTSISYPANPITDKEFTSPDNSYKYNFPYNWAFVKGREGKGLYPLDDSNYSSNNQEILTIASFDAGTDSLDPQRLIVDHYGLNFSQGEYLTLNSYKGYKATYITDSFTDLAYVLINKSAFIQVHFREKDNTRGTFIDNEKYLIEVERIVNSIKFLN